MKNGEIVKTTKLSSKGQVIIPADIREELRLKEGTEFAVRARGRAVVLEPMKRRSWRLWRGVLKGKDILAALEKEHRAEIERDAPRP